MPTALPESKPARRSLWLAVAVVVALLALTTWDVLRNSDRSSPAALRRAAFDGDETTVRRLIAAHPDWIDSVGSTNGLAPIFGGLYDKAMKGFGKSPSAPSSSDPEQLFQQLEGLGATPLFHAVAKKHISTAKLLLEARASPRAKLVSGWPLHFAAVAVGDTNLMAELERRGAKLDVIDPRSGMTLLHYAVYGPRTEMLEFLIEHGLSVNATNRIGATALHLAVAIQRLNMVEALVFNGADLAITNRLGYTALDAARLAVVPGVSYKAVAVVDWLEAYAATNSPPAKPAP